MTSDPNEPTDVGAAPIKDAGPTPAPVPAATTAQRGDLAAEDAGRPGEFSPEDLRAISDEVARGFPLPVEQTELVLMDVDPHRVHAYWNVNRADLASARTAAGGSSERAPMVLRFHDVTPGGTQAGRPSFDVEIQGLQNQRYVELWSDAKRYYAELGLRTGGGRLVLLARSNPVDLPRAGQSPEYVFATLHVDDPGPVIGRADTPEPAPPKDPSRSSPPTELVSAGMARALEAGFGDALGGPAPPPGTTDPEAARSGPRGPAAGGFTLAPDPGDRTLGSPAAAPDVLEPAFPEAFAWPATAPAADADASAMPPPGIPATLHPDLGHYAVQAVGLPDTLEQVEGRHPATGAALEESIVTLSSSQLGRRHPELEVNAELHVFGRARPGTTLTLFGRPVPLRPDGSFSIRRPLSEGALVIPLLALPGAFAAADDEDT